MPYRREGTVDGQKDGSVYFRPVKYDIVVFDEAVPELRINAGSVKEKLLYQRKFGFYLFGDEEHFPDTAKYTLEPLRNNGKQALVCTDIDGMDWVTLKELRFFWGGEYKEIEIRKADDLLAAFEKKSRTIPDKVPIIRASFQVKFSDAKNPRMVTIRPGNITEYTRDDDARIVEEWMRERKFIRPPSGEEDRDRTTAENVVSLADHARSVGD